MACKIEINKNINEEIDKTLTEGQVYDPSVVKKSVQELNNIWGVDIVEYKNYNNLGGAMLIKNQPGIREVVEREYAKQLTIEGNLVDPNDNIPVVDEVKEMFLNTPALNKIGSYNDYISFLKQEYPDKSKSDIIYYKYVANFQDFINEKKQNDFLQYNPVNTEFLSILAKYKADSLGIIHPEGRDKFTYAKLQEDLNKEFGDIFVVKVNEDNGYYVSRKDFDVNVVEEEGNKAISKAFSTSISDISGVPSNVITLADKLSRRFNIPVKMISEKQAREIRPGYKSGSKGFFDHSNNIAYIVYDKMGKATVLHEVFSHPFLIYIKQNYNGLYQTLLEKAKANTQVKSEVDAYYDDYSADAKDMEYITHAIDLEYYNQLKDTSLIKSIIRFWERIVAYVKDVLGIKQDISKFTTFSDLVKFALTSKEKINLTNVELMNLPIMDSYINEDDVDFDNINEPNLSSRSSLDLIRESVADILIGMNDAIQKTKEAIVSGTIELSNGEKEQLDTITARVTSFSKELYDTNVTKEALVNDKNLAVIIKYFSNIVKNSLASKEGMNQTQEILKTISNISQVMEEALVLTRYIKNQINDSQKSNINIIEKQKEINQYYEIMLAIESSLKELYDFYVQSDIQQSELISPVVTVLNAIFSDIKNAKDINSKYVIDYWTDRIFRISGYEETNAEFDKEIESETAILVNLINRQKTADNDRRKTYLGKEIATVNKRIQDLKRKRITKENIREVILGNYGDSNYLYLKYMAALNSPDLLISNVDKAIEQDLLKANRDNIDAANTLNEILEAFMKATGKTKADQFNIESFSKPIRRKATYDKISTKVEKVISFDEATSQTTEEEIFTEVLEQVEEDVFLNKFMVQELNAKLQELQFKVRKAAREQDKVELQKASLDYYNFRKKYFITPVTEEFDKRTVNSNLITEEDIKDLYDENGEPLSLEKNPELLTAAKEIIQPLFDKEEAYFTLTQSRIPTEVEVQEYEENKRKIKELSSFEILGTTTKKTGKALAIARAINRSRELKRGVFKYTPYESGKATYADRYRRQKDDVQKEINEKKITLKEGIRKLNNWHKFHSEIKISQDYFDLRSKFRTDIDNEFNKLLSNDNFEFITAFGFEDKTKTQKDNLDTLWSEIYDYLNPLKDVEGVVDGTIAKTNLQIEIKKNIERIENYQSKKDALLKLTNEAEFEKYFQLVENMEIGGIGIDNFAGDLLPNETTIRRKVALLDYNQSAFKDLRRILLSVPGAILTTEINIPEEYSKKLNQSEVEFLQSYLFRSTPYAQKLALLLKIELSKDTSLTPEQRKQKLEEGLNKELEILLDPQSPTTQFPNFQHPGGGIEYSVVYDKLKNYGKAVSKLFEQLSELSERVTTPYYDLTLDAIKQNIFKENFYEAIDFLKQYINYDNLDEEQQEKWDEEITWLEGATLRSDSLFGKSSLHMAKEILMKYLDEKILETEWYKNNHYKKLEKGEVTKYVYTPTPLWTTSIPTNEDYLTLEPNNAYKTRSVNEFLLDENGIPTNIRLKRGDTIIDAKQGDTLETLSQYYNISLGELEKMNPTITGILQEGDKVVIKKFGDRAFGNKEPREYLEDGTLSEYVDLEYKKLESQNPALVKVIDDINDIFYEHQNKTGMRGSQLLQAFPRVATSGWETILDESGPTVKKIWRKVKETVMITPQDEDRGYGKADFADVELQNIPLKFVSDIPYELRSRDAFGLLMSFIVHANEVSQLNALFPVTKELYNIVNANSPAVVREKTILSKLLPGGKLVPIRQKSGNNRGLHLGHMLNSKFFNRKKEQIKIGNFSLTKGYDTTAAMTSRATLGGFITPSIVMNYIVGKVQIWIEVWSGGIVSRDNYLKGLQRMYRYFSSDFNNDFYKLGNKSLYGQLMLKYNPTIKSALELFGQELKRTPVKDYLSMDVLFKTRRLAEFELSGGIVFGVLESYYVMDGDVQISLADGYELDQKGNIRLKKGLKKMNGQAFTQDDEDRIIIKATQLNMIIQGNYSAHHKPEFDTTFVGNMISFMRKHLGSYVEKAWSPRHYNYALDRFIGGYQRELWGTAIQMAKAIRNGNADDFNEELKIAKEKWKKDPTLKKAAIHNSILVLISILLAIVDSEDDDENKKTHSYDSFFAKAMIYQLMRLKSDLELASAIPFVAGLNESLNIIKSPSIVIDKTMVNLVKIGSHIIDYGQYKLGMRPEKDVVLSRDYYMYDKGDLKILKDFGQLTGFTGATFYPDEMVDKLQNINSALFR